MVSLEPRHHKKMSGATTKRPFPWLPMMAICTALVSNAYAMSNLFPYVGYMVQYLGVTDDKNEAGFYAGYVSSAMMVGRFGTSYLWGRFTDRYGRLPVMYISLLSMVVLSIAFGMSTSFYWAIACRFFLGAMNGLVATSKTMISEVCPKEHEVVGMSTITACMSFGLIVGPAIGGLLSEPAKQYSIFSEVGIFGRFPYLLPNLIGACIALAGLIMVFFFLPETEPTRARNCSGDSNGFKPLSTPERDTKDPVSVDKRPIVTMTNLTETNSLNYSRGSHDVNLAPGAMNISASTSVMFADNTDGIRTAEDRTRPLKEAEMMMDYRGSERRRLYHTGKGYNALDEEVDVERGDVRSACWTGCLVPMTLLSRPNVLGLLFVYGLFSFIKIGFNEMYPLWAMSTIASGGLDWTTNEIGECLSIAGVALLVFQMTIYSPLIKAAGIQRSQRVSSFVMVPIFMAMPLLPLLHDKGWVLIAANVVTLFFINIAANTIFINLALAINNAVDPSSRGTINGISMTTASLTKAAGPTFFAVVFAWSINRPRPFPFNYQLTFSVMAVLMAVVSLAGWDVIRIPNTEEDPNEEDCITTAADKEVGIDETSDRAKR